MKWPEQKAMELLKLKDYKQVELAQKMSSYSGRLSESLKILQFPIDDGINLMRLHDHFKNMKDACAAFLGVDLDFIERYKAFDALSKRQKVESLIKTPKTFYNYFYKVYLNYLSRRSKMRRRWKQSTYQDHLNQVKEILDRCIVNDSMSLDEAYEMSTLLFLAARARFAQLIVNYEFTETEVRQLATNRKDSVAQAA